MWPTTNCTQSSAGAALEEEGGCTGMSENVKLPREVADALKNSIHIGPASVMGHLTQLLIAGDSGEMMSTPDLLTIYHYYKENPYMIASAIVNGYEVEETPGEVVIRIFESRSGEDGSINSNVRKEIIEILNAYGHKVKGVNAWDF